MFLEPNSVFEMFILFLTKVLEKYLREIPY
jgi:hypothetical protein